MTNVFALARLPFQKYAVDSLKQTFAYGDEACATEVRMRVSVALSEQESNPRQQAESFFHAQQELGVVLAGNLNAELGTTRRQSQPSVKKGPSAALNLSVHVTDPLTPAAQFDFESFKESVVLAVRMLDNAIDVAPTHQAEQNDAREVRLGVLGLGSMLIMMGLTYGQPAAVALSRQVAEVLRDTAFGASIDLARERGAYRGFDGLRDVEEEGAFGAQLPAQLRTDLRLYGLRNLRLLSIEPTHAISLAFADNATSGIEPVQSYLTSVRTLDSSQPICLEDRTYRLYRWMHGTDVPLPSAFVTGFQLSEMQRSAIEEAFAPFVDGGITTSTPAVVTAD